ncbi:MAG: penicillin-binding transpeptidase domain-containing protein [Silvibacterium sp.]
MAITRRAVWLGMVFLSVLPQEATVQANQASSLFGQTAQSVLDRQFSALSLSYLLLDARSGQVLAERWTNEERPIPVGSLIKPFTAFFYAQNHRQFPVVICHGKRDACWPPRGHGRMMLTGAIAGSCNAYFLALARAIPVSEANRMLTEYSLPPVDQENNARALAGLDDDWRVAPLVFARAYLKLVRAIRNGPRADEGILRGMEDSAQMGTARAVESQYPVLAKTGTAECTHIPRAEADGFTVVLFPADDPRLLLLVRMHEATGAATAKVAGQMLKALEPGQS